MILYYYTTTEVMSYILSKGNIHATNVRYMNDSEEFVNGLREIKTLLLSEHSFFDKSAKENLEKETYEENIFNRIESFSISFTTARDLLSQWAIYAKESGVSLAMDFPEQGEMSFDTYNKKGKKVIDNYTLLPKKVEYFTKGVLSPDEYEKEAKIIIDRMKSMVATDGIMDINDDIINIWTGMAPYVKRADFGAEEEYRLVFGYNKSKKVSPRIDFRNDRNVLKPYIDIFRKDGWPIKEIIVGPGFNQDAVFKSVVYYLEKGKVLVPRISLNDFQSRIKEYFDEMERQISTSEDVVELRKKWTKIACGYSEGSKQTEANIVVNLYSDLYGFLKNTLKNTKNPQIRNYLEQNYISEHGIICRKSKIPYLF